MKTLSMIKQENMYKSGASSLLSNNQKNTALSRIEEKQKLEEESSKNKGGFFGGLGYTFEKLGLGFLSSIEGIWDYSAGGLAKLFGADDWAEQQFANDWVDYNHADDWYNPTEGWKVAGDIAGGIGTSLPAIVTVAAAGAIAVASGGTLSPVAAGLISAGIAGLGAAGNATKEAYQQTGELSGKEFGYGALVGVTEGAIEGISAGIGVGTGQVVKNISKSFGKEIATSATRQTLGKAIVKGFIGEAFEEGVAELVSPVWARLTYDPNAKDATFQEIGYAALIGGLSGAIMGGADVSLRNITSTARGSKIAAENKQDGVLEMARELSVYEKQNNTQLESFELVNNVYNELQASMKKTNGTISTVKQKMLLGVLEKANTTAVFSPIVNKSAMNIVNNAEVIAERLTAFGYTDAKGNPLQFTAEQIRQGVDMNNPKSFSKALKTNDILRSLAVADATGQISINAAKFKESVLMGQQLSSQVDLNRFIETATESELQAVGEKLGIDNWETITNDQLLDKITQFVENDGVETYKKERLIIREAENIAPDTARNLPKVVNMTADGAARFILDDSQMAIIKEGNTYRTYDYTSKRLSKPLTKQELNKLIRQINKQRGQVAAEVTKQLEQESELKKQAAELDSYARENISNYNNLSAANQSMVRAVIRQGRAAGVSEDFVLTAARVAARSGLNIVFNKEASFVAANGTFADGAIDLKNNRIIINPESKNRTGEMILIHELTHAIYNLQNGVLQVAEGLETMSAEEKQAIRKRYSKIGKSGIVEISDEINAHFAEQTLSNKNILERLVAKKPTVKEKILNFFKSSSKDYKEDVKLTGAANKLFKQYKKLFDEFSAHNQGTNAVETVKTNQSKKAYAIANDDKNSYNNQKGAVDYGKETSKANQTTENSETIKRNDVRSDSGQRVISVFNDYGTVRQLSEIVKNSKTAEKLSEFFTEIYTKPQTETQDNLVWHAQNEDITIYFAKPRNNSANIYSFDGKNLIVNENLSEKNLVDILNKEKPIKRIISSDKIAHISSERWNKFLDWHSDAYLTRIPIQQFLDMTTDDYVTQRQLNARSSQISKKVSVENIKNTADEFMYLEIDLKNKRVTNHEGRHRMTALLNAGNAFADVFVVPVNDVGVESYGNIEVQGQFNTDKHNLGLVRAKSGKFANAINEVFRKDDGNIRYALPDTDSKGNALTDKQREYFAESKVVDDNGKLKVVYHGSRAEIGFTEFRNEFISKWNAFGDGFYFTDNYDRAIRFARTRLYETYINLKNPLYGNNQKQVNMLFNKLGIARAEVMSFAKENYLAGSDLFLLRHYIDSREYVDGKKLNVNMAQAIQELGFDGVINNNLDDVEYIVYNSNQIKEINNIRPTFNDDIRYALDSNEDIKDLVAIHNTTESKLLQTIELGGLPMPSIAIIKSDMAHENFGNISLVLKSRSIDPRYDYDNKVYSADAYSPRFPHVAYSLNSKELKALAEKMNTSVSMLEANDFAEGNSRERIIDSLKYNDKFIQHYLTEFNVKPEIAYKDPAYSNVIFRYEELKSFLLKGYSFDELINKETVRNELNQAVEDAKSKLNPVFKQNILLRSYEQYLRKLDDAKAEDYIYKIVEQEYNYDREIAQGKVDKVEDSYQTRQNTIEKLKNDSEFNSYVEKTVDKILKKKYLRNNKDYYTSSGNPRSFEALYDEYNAENAVRIMKEQGGKNSEGGNIFGFGIGEIRAALSKKYESISEIKQDKYKLQDSTEESAKLYEECNDELHNIADRLSKRVKTGNFLEERDIALNAIFDIIASTKTNEQAHRLMKRDYSFDVTDVEIVKIRQLAKKVADLPVKYFEAKPERIVTFDEIVKIFVPENINQKIIDFFTERGIDIQIYDEVSPTRAELVKTLPDDVKFALPMDDNEDTIVGGLTKGQRAKFVANNTKLKVYSKTDAADIINSIIDERLVLGDKYGSLSGKSKSQAIDMLFRQLNATTEGYRGTAALHIADYLIENTILNDMYVDDSSEAMWQLKILQGYMHKVDLKSIQSEINYKYDKKNSINLVWGAKQGGMAPDVIAQELNSLGVRIDAINEADCFFEMVDTYNSLKAQINKSVDKLKLSTFGSETQLETLRQEIARDILLAYDEKGTQSKYGKLVEKYTTKIQSLKRQVKETERRNNVLNAALEKAQNMKDLKLGTFLNATEFKSDIFKQSIERLGKIKWRGNLNSSGTHRIMADLKQWYVKDNPILEDCYEQGIADMLDVLSTGNAKYSTDELVMLNNVLSYFTNFVKNYNRVYKQGKWIEALPEAEKYIDILHSNEKIKVGLFKKFAGSTYTQTFGDPMTVARRMDRYENGFFSDMMIELRDASIDAEVSEMEIKQKYNEFLTKNKKYVKNLQENITYKGVEIPKAHLIGLYMTMKREQAHAGLVLSGFSFIDKKGKKIRVPGFATGASSEADILTAVEDERVVIDKLLSATDKEYISILEVGYNQDAKKLKADRDMQRLGYTNAQEDYYYPIRRGNIAKNVDTSEFAAELDRVSNASFNKDTVKGAKQELFIESADTVYNRHIKAVTKYAYLSPAIDTFNRLYNLDISGDRNKPISVATESQNTWSKGKQYFSKLISDIQGIPSSSSEGMKLLSFLRGSYAKFQLGANPKVWVTQLSSIFASSSILETNSIIKGMTVSAKDVDIYCPLAKLRNSDNAAAMAQGVLDRVGKVGNVLMAPIGKVDRFVVKRLFGACQVQVQKNTGAKIGTTANKIEAGKLLRKVILETQQNSISTERSAAMRSGNEILRTVTMFSADSMKVIGRVIDSFGELGTLKTKLKQTKDTQAQAKIKAQIKIAEKKCFKSVIALVTSAAFMAGVAKLFRWLYDKEDDKENSAETVIVDFVGNLFGGLPLIRDVYSRLVEGYSLDNYAYSALNDLLDSAASLISVAEKLMSGNASQQDIAKSIKQLSYAAGQILGIPTRNIYNIAYGLTKRVSPTSAYKIDNVFYKKNYLNDLKKAIEDDDIEMVSMLLNLVLDERTGGDYSENTLSTLRKLYSSGYSVLPKSVGDSISYNGEEIPLSESQKTQFKKTYSQANAYVDKMILTSNYKMLSEENKAKAIKQVFDAYYAKAVAETLGVENNNNLLTLSKYISIDTLSPVFVGLSLIESDKDSSGKTITGSKKKKVIKYLLTQNLSDEQRLFILAYKGYSIQDKEFRGYSEKIAKNKLLKFILGLKTATQAEKAKLAQICGFEVKNGKIISQTPFNVNK